MGEAGNGIADLLDLLDLRARKQFKRWVASRLPTRHSALARATETSRALKNTTTYCLAFEHVSITIWHHRRHTLLSLA